MIFEGEKGKDPCMYLFYFFGISFSLWKKNIIVQKHWILKKKKPTNLDFLGTS